MKHSKNEDELIRKVEGAFARPNHLGVRLGIGDDAALFAPRKGYDVVLTCDWFLEGVHFLREKHPPDAIGWKCLARAVSDIAAMGAQPRCFLLSLALPASHTGKWLTGFLGGLRRASKSLRCTLAGGDTTSGGKILISVTVIGEVRRGDAVLRSGARPGDAIFVSGRLGEAELGLRTLRARAGVRGRAGKEQRKHLYPEPRLGLGEWIAKQRLATAMMDLSDGLSVDLPRLCAASHAGAVVEPQKLPLPRATSQRGRAELISLALHGGEDYELLFTVARRNASRIPARYEGVPLTRIGDIVAESGVSLRDEHGGVTGLPRRGWDPFRR